MQKISTFPVLLLLCTSLMLFSAKSQAQLKANFTMYADSGCTQFTDTFTNTTSGGTLPYKYLWDLGDSQYFTTKKCNTIYKKAGIFHITLYVTDATGKTDSITKIVKVLASPKADYSATIKDCDLAFFQAARTLASPTSISKYLWVGDGAAGHGPMYIPARIGEYQYTSGGTYHYSLIITGANGCVVNYEDSLHISSYPGISLPRDTTVCSNSSITITAIHYGGAPPYTIWWNHKSANITGPVITPTIVKDTAFAVHILDANGCYNYDSVKVFALPLPNAHWTMNYVGNASYFHAIDSSLADSSYHWFFGDGDVAIRHSTEHIYAKKISYNINLAVINSNGCLNQYDSTIYVDKAGIEMNNNDHFSLDLYPNPFQTFATIQYTLAHRSDIRMALYDITGKMIVQITNESEAQGAYKTDIDAGKLHLSPGVYVLKFVSDYENTSLHIVKL